jgi:hypothetical protein
MHDDQIIGILNGEKYIRVIFPLINTLIFLLLLLLTVIFIIHLFINRKILEQTGRGTNPKPAGAANDGSTTLSKPASGNGIGDRSDRKYYLRQ